MGAAKSALDSLRDERKAEWILMVYFSLFDLSVGVSRYYRHLHERCLKFCSKINIIAASEQEIKSLVYSSAAGATAAGGRQLQSVRPFPKTHTFIDIYNFFRLSCFYYTLIKELLGPLVARLFEMLGFGALAERCFVLGNLSIMEPGGSFNRHVPVIVAVSQLVWHWMRICWSKQMCKVNLFLFYLIDQRDFEHFNQLFASSSAVKLDLDEPSNHQELARLLEIPAASSINQHAQISAKPFKPTTPIEFYILNIVCRQTSYRGQTIYQPRPNRHKLARSTLCKQLSNLLLASTLSIIGLTAIITPSFVFPIFTTNFYLTNYPICNSRQLADAELKSQAAEYIWQSPITVHRVIALMADLMHSFFILIPLAVVLSIGSSLLHISTQDILLYLGDVQSRLVRLKESVQLHHLASKAAPFVRSESPTELVIGIGPEPITMISNTPQLSTPISYSHYQPEPALTRQLADSSTRVGGFSSQRANLDQEVWDFQNEFCDLIRMIKCSDKFSSDYTTAITLTWLAFWVAYVYTVEIHGSDSIPFTMNLCLAIGFTSNVISCLGLLMVHKKLISSYRHLCSVMAFDQSPSKLRFTKLIDFYTQRGGPAYTIFSAIPFTSFTYLNMIGWTLSSLFIVESLLGRRIGTVK